MTLHDVNGHAGVVLLVALLLGAGGGLPAAASGVCGCCWVMVGVGFGCSRSSIGESFSGQHCMGHPSGIGVDVVAGS